MVAMTLLAVLGVLTLIFLVAFAKDLSANRNNLEKGTNFWIMGVIGFVTNFFDVFGIGSFATGTALMKIFKQTEDRLIPGTLNVCFVVPVVMEAFLFIHGVDVQPPTLASMIIAAVAGAWLGAGIVARLSTRIIRLFMGSALVIAAVIISMQILNLIPAGGAETGLSGVKLAVGVAVNFCLGIVMTAGVGMYAPCLALVCLLGMNPIVAFPIMMGSSAYLMPVASVRFIKEGAYNRKGSFAISLFGILGVIVGYMFISMLDMSMLKFIVVLVMLYTAASMFYSEHKDAAKKKESVRAAVREA